MNLSVSNSVLSHLEAEVLTLTLNRVGENNSLNSEMLKVMHQSIDFAEAEDACRIVVVKGQQGVFSKGMDFENVIGDEEKFAGEDQDVAIDVGYAKLLNRMATSKMLFISAVDGDVMAGGVGIVAASDLVFATPNSQFSLTEAMWGLLPANVTPYLIRRVGYQPALRMTITTEKVNAKDALRMNLVDYLTDDLDNEIKKKRLLLRRVAADTVGDVKAFFRSQWFSSGPMEIAANEKMLEFQTNDKVKNNIKQYINSGLFPWE